MKDLFKPFCALAFLTSLTGVAIASESSEKFQSRPKLLLVVVIDQFRADYLTRFEKKLLPPEKKGFQLLMSRGAYYPFASYDILQCMTGPGHSIIGTGSYPYLSGIPINEWFDGKSRVYCVEDESQKTIGNSIDTHLGTSPKLLRGTTIGDELKNAGFKSKAVSVALKDRASILMGGHRADLAIWNDKKAGWTSSTYYLKNGELPDWVNQLNKDQSAKSACALTEACAADMTTKAAKAAIDAFKLGKNENTDILTVSYSGHDYAGHKVGPNHEKMEDLTLAEDKSISELLTHVDENVPGGLKNVVVVLTADHGIPPSPEYLADSGIESGRIDQEALLDELEKSLAKKLGNSGKDRWISHTYEFNFYLNAKLLADKKIPAARAEMELKSLLAAKSSFLFVVTKTEIRDHKLPPRIIGQEVINTYVEGRSGDVIAIVKPYFIPGKETTTHMTGYSYDTTVPLILFGKNIRSGVFLNPANIVDIAPTLTAISGVIKPSLSEGRILSEALEY